MWLSFFPYYLALLGLVQVARISAIPAGRDDWKVGDVPVHSQDDPNAGEYHDAWHHYESGSSSLSHPVGDIHDFDGFHGNQGYHFDLSPPKSPAVDNDFHGFDPSSPMFAGPPEIPGHHYGNSPAQSPGAGLHDFDGASGSYYGLHDAPAFQYGISPIQSPARGNGVHGFDPSSPMFAGPPEIPGHHYGVSPAQSPAGASHGFDGTSGSPYGLHDASAYHYGISPHQSPVGGGGFHGFDLSSPMFAGPPEIPGHHLDASPAQSPARAHAFDGSGSSAPGLHEEVGHRSEVSPARSPAGALHNFDASSPMFSGPSAIPGHHFSTSPAQSPEGGYPILDSSREPFAVHQASSSSSPSASAPSLSSLSLSSSPEENQNLQIPPSSVIDWFDVNAAQKLGLGDERLRRARQIFDNNRVQWRLWLTNLEAIVAGRRLYVSPINPGNHYQDRVFYAHDGEPAPGHYPVLTPEERALRIEDGSHLVPSTFGGKVEYGHTLSKTEKLTRVFVYLNSRHIMDTINREYFLDHAQFLRINHEALTRENLNRIITARRKQITLPPHRQGGLPLILLRHSTSGRHVSPSIQALVGSESPTNLMSLWAPVLYDGRRYTLVLYGIVRFDSRFASAVRDHLSDLAEGTDPNSYHNFYRLPAAAHLVH